MATGADVLLPPEPQISSFFRSDSRRRRTTSMISRLISSNEHVRRMADQYWSSNGGAYPEVITESPLRVVRTCRNVTCDSRPLRSNLIQEELVTKSD